MDVSRRTAHARCTKCGSNGGPNGGIPASSGHRVPFRALPLEHPAVAQLLLATPAKLAPVVVAGEEEGVGYLTTEPARHVDELDEPDDRRPRNRQPLALHDRSLRLDDLRLAVDHEPQR